MTRYLLAKLGTTCLSLAGVVTVAFFLLRAIPGDPAAYMLGDFATQESLAALRRDLGLDRPIWVQYGTFVRRVATGDLGKSIVTQRSALEEVRGHIGPSALLTVSGVLIAVLVGVPLGVLSAKHQGSWLDLGVMTASLAGISFPVFAIGLWLILLFALHLRVLPALGAGITSDVSSLLRHLILPAAVLGISVTAYIARLTRSAMLEVLNQDYIRTARAFGVSEGRLTAVHGLRNALVPILAVVGVTFAWSLGNAILVEVVFARPGMGSLVMKAVFARDYQVVQAAVLVLAVGVVLTNAALDLLYAVVDPRIRLGGAEG